MTRRPINPDDLLSIRNLVGAALSPDGARVAYATTRIELEASAEHVDLHLLDVTTGAAKQLTFTDTTNGAPAFSPGGSTLAFLSTRAGTPQIWLLPLDGGEARQLTTLAQGVGGGPAWSPDGRHIAFTAGQPGERRDPTAPYRVTRTIWRGDGVGLIDDAIQDVYVVDVEGGEPRRLTDDRLMNMNPKWMPDSQSLVYSAGCDPDSPALASRVCRVTLDGEVTQLTGLDGMVFGPGVASDGRVVFVLAFETGTTPGVRWPLYVLDPATGERVRRGADVDGHIGGGIQADIPALALGAGQLVAAEGSAFVGVQRGGSVNISRFPLSGADREEALVTGERVAVPLAVADNKLLFIAFTAVEPGDLYLLDLVTGQEQRLTSLNADLLGQLALPTVETVSFPSSDGVQVEGWFLRPAEATAPYPTVLAIHGGPHAGFGHHFYFDALMLTGAGFGVLLINHRASTGYGDEFATAIYGDWGGLDYADLMAGVDHAVAVGLADSDRLGVFGVSGGGNLTGWVIGHTDRFKAACPENPLFNWISMYGTSDVGVFMGHAELGGAPHEIPDVYLRCSPISYAHQVTTPTLFMQHENDFRCPAEQTEQFYTVLRVNGVPTEMLRFPGTSHGGSAIGPISHRRAQNDALLDWMTRYVLGKEEKSTDQPRRSSG